MRAQLGQHRSLGVAELATGQVPQEHAHPGALVGDPVDGVVAVLGPPAGPVRLEPVPLLVGAGHARMVQGDDLPLVVEHRRPRVARLGVGLVVEELVQDGLEGVVADRDLLQPPHRVADHVDRLAHGDLALLGDQPVPAELLAGGPAVRPGLDRDQRVVEMRVGQEQRLGVQAVGGGRPGDVVQVDLPVELGRRLLGRGHVGQDVVVGQQQPLADQRPRPRRHQPPPPVIGDPRHRPGRPGSPGQEVDRLQVVGRVDDPLQQHVRLERLAGADRRHQRLGLHLPGLGQAGRTGPDPLGRVDDLAPSAFCRRFSSLRSFAIWRYRSAAAAVCCRRSIADPLRTWSLALDNDRPVPAGAVPPVAAAL